jgi:hypothetical protein
MATTTGALAQTALNIAQPIQQNILNGQYIDVYKALFDLCGAVIALADAQYAILNAAATPSLTTSVATTPAVDNAYSATQAWPVLVQTSNR